MIMNYSLAVNLLSKALNENAQVPEGMGEKFIYALQISAIGLGMVFLVLALLMGVIYLFQLFFYTIPNRKKAAEGVQEQPAEQIVPEAVQSVSQGEDEGEIAAVIAAVIESYYSSARPDVRSRKKYVIRSFKQID